MIVHVPTAKLRMRTKEVYPSDGDLLLRCQCESTKWRAHVRPMLDGQPMMVEIVCDNCQRIIKLDDANKLDVTGVKGELSRGCNH